MCRCPVNKQFIIGRVARFQNPRLDTRAMTPHGPPAHVENTVSSARARPEPNVLEAWNPIPVRFQLGFSRAQATRRADDDQPPPAHAPDAHSHIRKPHVRTWARHLPRCHASRAAPAGPRRVTGLPGSRSWQAWALPAAQRAGEAATSLEIEYAANDSDQRVSPAVASRLSDQMPIPRWGGGDTQDSSKLPVP